MSIQYMVLGFEPTTFGTNRPGFVYCFWSQNSRCHIHWQKYNMRVAAVASSHCYYWLALKIQQPKFLDQCDQNHFTDCSVNILSENQCDQKIIAKCP